MPSGNRLLALLALWLMSVDAQAHLLNMTRVSISHEGTKPGELQVEIDLGQSLLSPKAYWALATGDEGQRGPTLARVVTQLEQGIVLSIDGIELPKRFMGADLPADSLSAIRNPLNAQMATLRWALPATAGRSLEVSLRPDLDVPWPCLVRSDSDRRALPSSDLLTADRRSTAPLGLTEASVASSSGGSLGALIAVYAALGFEHILPLGLDHLLFVIGLVLVGGTARQLALLLSCFTIAHSLTLASATLGVFRLPPAIVEPLIAASIVYVGLERLLGRSRATRAGPWRFAVVFAFGLLHGLGFAQVLSQIGLPTGRYLAALLSFNVGVELGQLTVLAIALLLLARWHRHPWYEACIATPGATVVAGTGLYWLVQRLA